MDAQTIALILASIFLFISEILPFSNAGYNSVLQVGVGASQQTLQLFSRSDVDSDDTL